MLKPIYFCLSLCLLMSCGGSEDDIISSIPVYHTETIIDCAFPDSFEKSETATYVVTNSKLFNGTYSFSKAPNNEIDVVLFNPDGSSNNFTFAKYGCTYVSINETSNFMVQTLLNLPDFIIAGVSDYLDAIGVNGNVIKELPSIIDSRRCESQENSEPWSDTKQVCNGDFIQETVTFKYIIEIVKDLNYIPGGKGVQKFIMKVDEEIIFEVELTEWNFI